MFFSDFQFFYKDVLEFQTCISGIQDLFLILTVWKLEVFRLEGAEGGHLRLSAGMGAGARMGLLWELKGRPYIFLHCHLPFLREFVNIVSTTGHIALSHPCQWWQWGLRPSAFCFLSHAFFLSHILTFSRSSLSFPSLLLCRSHSFGDATVKGSYGQPCLTRRGLDPV